MIKSFYHVGMSVRDIDRSVAFYRDLLHMDVIVAPKPFSGPLYDAVMNLRDAAGRVAIVRGAGLELELFQFSHPTPPPATQDRPVYEFGITHFCLEVTDIESEYERMRNAGVRFHCSPQNHRGIALATYARDPDGNVFELVEFIGERPA
jgi:catechol 2,3-dioxygenase-like lactoylglutathione lyase family enzyme